MSRVDRGRWVILFDDKTPPAFWSSERETLERLCDQLRGTFPTAQVVWEPSTPSVTWLPIRRLSRSEKAPLLCLRPVDRGAPVAHGPQDPILRIA